MASLVYDGVRQSRKIAEVIAQAPAILSVGGLLFFMLSVHDLRSFVDMNSPEGMLCNLSPFFWAGFGLVMVAAILLSYDHDHIERIGRQRVLVLCVFTIFLYGTKVFFLSNERDLGAYYPLSQVTVILAHGHFDLMTPPLSSYYAWPGTHMIAAFLALATGIRLEWLIKYGPIFWALSFTLISYAAGKAHGLTESQSYMFSLLMASSFWLIQSDVQPTGLSYLLILMFFMLKGKSRRLSVSLIGLILLFALVVIHPFVSFFVVLLSVFLLIPTRRWEFIALGLVAFAGWNVSVNALIPLSSIDTMRVSFMHLITLDFSHIRSGHVGQPSMSSIVNGFFRYVYLLIYGTFALAAFVSIIRRNTKRARDRITVFSIAWISAAGSLLFLAYGNEILQRAYILALPAAALCTVATCRFRSILIGVFLVTTLCFFPATYLCPTQVPTSELEGTRFYSFHADHSKKYFYESWFSWFLISYHNPEISPHAVGNCILLLGERAENMTELDQYRDLGQLYVIRSTQTHYYRLYQFGRDKVELWLDENIVGTCLLYNNGYFRIYAP